MQTKYYLSFEQVGIIRRIPLKEQDPDMQGILDAFIKAFRIANELGDEEEVTTPDLINSLNHIDDIYIDTVEIYEDGFEMIEQKVPLGDASKCVRNLLQIIQYDEIFDSAAKDIANELRLNLRVSWKHIHPDSPGPEEAFINQFYTEVINRLKTKL
jgi:uncharacterized protein (DUF2267 family)